MKIAKIVTALGLVAMTGVLIYGFSAGDFFMEGGQLARMPWGIVSLVDLYVGFTLFSGWIFYRESSRLRAVVWIVLIMVMGFWAGSLYAFLALRASRDDWSRFWMGKHAAPRRRI